MPRTRERSPRFVEPEATIEPEYQARHYALAVSWVLFAITLLALFASATIQGGGIHGWYWALAAVPGILLAVSLVLTAQTLEGRRGVRRRPR